VGVYGIARNATATAGVLSMIWAAGALAEPPVTAIFYCSMAHAFLLTLQFDGAGFCGWQRQRDGHSVQAALEKALGQLAGGSVTVIAAGRTDSGVHAEGMPVSVTMPDRWTSPELLRATNSLLPDSIAVRAVRKVRAGTNARRSALNRKYRYDVGCDAAGRSPFRNKVEWSLAKPLDLGALERSAGVLRGEHDFRAFAAVGEPKPHYRCRVTEARWQQLAPGRLRFTVEADRFLYRMVRFLVGTMVQIGIGRLKEEEMARLLRLTHNQETPSPAPPEGLAFVAADYPADLFLEDGATW
jgi:tRNA pseudouridine38-40 synthase